MARWESRGRTRQKSAERGCGASVVATTGRCALGDAGRPTGLRARWVALLPPVAEGREKSGPVSVDCRAIGAPILSPGLPPTGQRSAKRRFARRGGLPGHRGPHKAQKSALRCFALEARRRDDARRGKTLHRSLVAAACSGAAERLLCAPCATICARRARSADVARRSRREKDAPEEREARVWRGGRAAKRTRQKSAEHDHGAE